MKAVILEIRDGYAAALREDGVVVKTRNFGGRGVGESIELTAEVTRVLPSRRRRFARSAVAALLALAVTGGTLGYMTTTASAYVSLDTEDTSVELTVNHFGRVIGVRALDSGSESLAAELLPDVRHLRIEDAMDAAAEHLGRGSEGCSVLVGVSSGSASRSSELSEAAERSFERGDGMTVQTVSVSPDERSEAMRQDRSGGRYAYEQHFGRPFEGFARPDGEHAPPPQGGPAFGPPPEGAPPQAARSFDPDDFDDDDWDGDDAFDEPDDDDDFDEPDEDGDLDEPDDDGDFDDRDDPDDDFDEPDDPDDDDDGSAQAK